MSWPDEHLPTNSDNTFLRHLARSVRPAALGRRRRLALSECRLQPRWLIVSPHNDTQRPRSPSNLSEAALSDFSTVETESTHVSRCPRALGHPLSLHVVWWQHAAVGCAERAGVSDGEGSIESPADVQATSGRNSCLSGLGCLSMRVLEGGESHLPAHQAERKSAAASKQSPALHPSGPPLNTPVRAVSVDFVVCAADRPHNNNKPQPPCWATWT